MNDLSVFLVDDHTLFRTGLSEVLSKRDLEVIGTTGDPVNATQLIQQAKPDVVLLDLRMRELGGLEVLRQIRELMPTQCVVILTTSIDEEDLLAALRLGAMGYLLKDMEPDNFVSLLYQAKAGETVVAPDLTGLLARAAVSRDDTPKPPPENHYNLTPREMDILSHIAKGESNKSIAKALGIVDGTVKLHARAVMKKLGVQSRVQAAVMAVSENLCPDKPPG